MTIIMCFSEYIQQLAGFTNRRGDTNDFEELTCVSHDTSTTRQVRTTSVASAAVIGAQMFKASFQSSTRVVQTPHVTCAA